MSNTVCCVGDANMIRAYGVITVINGRDLVNAGITLPRKWAISWSSATQGIVQQKMLSVQESSAALIMSNSPPDPAPTAPKRIAANTIALAKLLKPKFRRVSIVLDVPDENPLWKAFFAETIHWVTAAWDEVRLQLGGQLLRPSLTTQNIALGGPRDMTGLLSAEGAEYHLRQALLEGRRTDRKRVDPRKSHGPPAKKTKYHTTPSGQHGPGKTGASQSFRPPLAIATATLKEVKDRHTQTSGGREVHAQLGPLVSSAEKAWSSNAELQREIGQLLAQAGTLHPAMVQAVSYAVLPRLNTVVQRLEVVERVLLSVDNSQLREALGLPIQPLVPEQVNPRSAEEPVENLDEEIEDPSSIQDMEATDPTLEEEDQLLGEQVPSASAGASLRTEPTYKDDDWVEELAAEPLPGPSTVTSTFADTPTTELCDRSQSSPED